jgi:hypothetical protein
MGVKFNTMCEWGLNLTPCVNGGLIITLGVNGGIILKSNAICLKSLHIVFPTFPKTAFPMTFPVFNPLQVPLKP